MEGEVCETEIKDIQFRWRRFQAPAQRIWANRYVFRLDVPPSPIACWLSSWMPQLVRSWLVRLLPEWFLPTSVILKERNPQRADSYENEIDTYHRLQSLQGTYIPRFFGEVAVIYPPAEMRHQISQRPTPAILLENVKGVPLQIEELEDRRLHEELRCVYDKLTEHGVLHGDPRLHNFLRHSERVVAIDFEFSRLLSNSNISNEDDFRTFESMVRQMREEDLVSGVTIVDVDT